jgi:cell division transport system permease protein
VIGFFMSATMVINQLVESVENQVAISIWIRDDAAEEDVWALQSYIGTIPGVGDVRFITKEEALERFREDAKNTNIVNSFEDNPLPASIEIDLTDPSRISEVADIIMATEIFSRVCDDPDNPAQSVRYGQETVERLFSLTRIIRVGSTALVGLLIFVALIFINNTIRLSIFARREEISIMRLVGASNGFIRRPFLLEGIVQALIGSGLAVLTIHGIVQGISNNVLVNIPWLTINFTVIPMQWIYLLLLAAGVFLAVLGSGWAMNRYLKV